MEFEYLTEFYKMWNKATKKVIKYLKKHKKSHKMFFKKPRAKYNEREDEKDIYGTDILLGEELN